MQLTSRSVLNAAEQWDNGLFLIYHIIKNVFRFSNGRHRQIVFSDEKIFTIEQTHNQQNDRIYAMEPPDTEDRMVVHQQHPKQVMVWAGICHGAKLPLVFHDPEYMYGQLYYRHRVLREVVRPWAREHFGRGNWTFQQVWVFKVHILMKFLGWSDLPHSKPYTRLVKKKRSGFHRQKPMAAMFPRLKSFGLLYLVNSGGSCWQRGSYNNWIT